MTTAMTAPLPSESSESLLLEVSPAPPLGHAYMLRALELAPVAQSTAGSDSRTVPPGSVISTVALSSAVMFDGGGFVKTTVTTTLPLWSSILRILVRGILYVLTSESATASAKSVVSMVAMSALAKTISALAFEADASAAMSRSPSPMMMTNSGVGESVGAGIGEVVSDSVRLELVVVSSLLLCVGEVVVGGLVGGLVGGNVVGVELAGLSVGLGLGLTVGENVSPSSVGAVMVGLVVGSDVEGLNVVGGLVGGSVGGNVVGGSVGGLSGVDSVRPALVVVSSLLSPQSGWGIHTQPSGRLVD